MKYSISNCVFGLLFLIGLINLLFTKFEIQNFDLLTKISLVSSYSICSYIILDYIFKLSNQNEFPILPLVCFYFIACYLGPAFFQYQFFLKNNFVDISAVSFAVKIFFLGLISMLIGYFIYVKLLGKLQKKEINILKFNIDGIFIYGFLINIFLLIFFYIFNIQSIIPGFSQVKVALIFLGFGLFTNYLAQNKKLFKIKVFIIFVIKFIIIYLELIEGSYSLPFLLIFLDYVYYSFIRKKINLTPLLAFFLIFFVVHEGKYQFRKLTWDYDEQKSENFIAKSNSFLKTYRNSLKEGFKVNQLIDVNKITYIRLFHSFESLVIVTSKSPNKIPFWNGYSYKIFSTKFIPRIFWKEKPIDNLGNQFGVRYILNEGDTGTSWNMPVLNEMYVNFGIKGVTFGMLLIGFIIGFFTKFFSIKNYSNIEHVIAFYLFVPIFFLESHASLIFGALLQSYFFLIVLSIAYSFSIKFFKIKL